MTRAPLPSSSSSTQTILTSSNNNPAIPSENHHSRLTRFLSKFTAASIHSKRKSSLPNLHHQLPTTTSSQTSSKRSLSHHLPIHPNDANSTLKPNSISLQPLLPLPTISDRRSSSFDQIRHLNQTPSSADGATDAEDGADPNASIRPLTPSSKAASVVSPNDARTRELSSIDLTEQESPTDSRASERQSSRRRKPSSNSSCSSEPDDCKSTFGNSSLASTKPTTVVSVENPPGNRIAQPHPAAIIHSTMAQPSLNLRNRVMLNHQRVQSGSSNPTFAAATPNTTAPPTLAILSSPPVSPQNHMSIVNVPTHSLPHPSQNPHPAALADNASILTLASSGFSPSLHNNTNFQSDEDASVRALAPSRRESVESLSSRWSNVKSNRSTRTTATGINFFTGITTNMNGDNQLSPMAVTTPNGTGIEGREDDSRPDELVTEADLKVEVPFNNQTDRPDIVDLGTREVPSVGTVNG